MEGRPAAWAFEATLSVCWIAAAQDGSFAAVWREAQSMGVELIGETGALAGEEEAPAVGTGEIGVALGDAAATFVGTPEPAPAPTVPPKGANPTVSTAPNTMITLTTRATITLEADMPSP